MRWPKHSPRFCGRTFELASDMDGAVTSTAPSAHNAPDRRRFGARTVRLARAFEDLYG